MAQRVNGQNWAGKREIMFKLCACEGLTCRLDMCDYHTFKIWLGFRHMLFFLI